MAALPVGGGSAPAGREELQLPESRAPVAVFLAQVAVSPVAAADVTPRGGSTVAFGVWVWKSRETTCRGARKTFSQSPLEQGSRPQRVFGKGSKAGLPRGGEGLGWALSVEYESWRPAN